MFMCNTTNKFCSLADIMVRHDLFIVPAAPCLMTSLRVKLYNLLFCLICFCHVIKDNKNCK